MQGFARQPDPAEPAKPRDDAVQKPFGGAIPILVCIAEQGEACRLEAQVEVHGCGPDRQQSGALRNQPRGLVGRHDAPMDLECGWHVLVDLTVRRRGLCHVAGGDSQSVFSGSVPMKISSPSR